MCYPLSLLSVGVLTPFDSRALVFASRQYQGICACAEMWLSTALFAVLLDSLVLEYLDQVSLYARLEPFYRSLRAGPSLFHRPYRAHHAKKPDDNRPVQCADKVLLGGEARFRLPFRARPAGKHRLHAPPGNMLLLRCNRFVFSLKDAPE
jgi:hypothetical protein